MSASDVTAGEFYDSITGEERGLVRRAFKEPLARMSKEDPETFIEALVFVDLHRQREPDPKAKAHAMSVGELQGYFSDDEEDEESGEA